MAGSYRSDYYVTQYGQRYNDRTFETAIFGAVLGGITAAVLYEASRPQPVYYERRHAYKERRHAYRQRHKERYYERRHYRRHQHDHCDDHGHHRYR